MFTDTDFQTFVDEHKALAAPLSRAMAAARGPRQDFTVGLVEGAALVALFPVVRFVVTRIGLPWLHEARRYSELWRLRFHDWIDGEYQRAGLDLDQAEAAGEALREALEKTTDAGARESWERLAALLGGDEAEAEG